MSRSKFFILLSVFVFQSVTGLAQEKKNDVVHLKNGSIIRGNILDSTGGKIRILTYSKNEWVFDTAKVARIESSAYLPEINETQLVKKTGFTNLTNISLAFGGETTFSGAQLQTINGYIFNPHFSAGIGASIDLLFNDSRNLTPVFLDFRGSFSKKNFSPVYMLQVGRTIIGQSDNANFSDETGGLLYGAGIGVRRYFQKNMAYFLALNYRQLQFSLERPTWREGRVETLYTLNRIYFQFGFQF